MNALKKRIHSTKLIIPCRLNMLRAARKKKMGI